jgi:hypothetical protein
MNSQNRPADTLPSIAGLAGLEIDEDGWASVVPRNITPHWCKQFEGYVEEIFTALGMPAALARSNAAAPDK